MENFPEIGKAGIIDYRGRGRHVLVKYRDREKNMNIANIEIQMDAVAEICRRYSVSELSLFGSVLRDDFRHDSDVDILVAFKPDAEIGFMEYSRMQRDLSTALGRKVDMVSKTGLKAVIRDDVIASSRIIYAE